MMAITKSGIQYLDMQAYVGITKHIGGQEASDELLALCHIEQARDVLNAGCGIGLTSAYVAGKYNCHVMGVDISEKMIAWSRQRAREKHVTGHVDFRVADILNLPFETNRFDAVIVESVVAFVEDKPRALSECIRVARPGGYVGLNESFFMQMPTPELAHLMQRTCGGGEPPLQATWQTLWDESGLEDRVVRICTSDARREIRGRLQWIGWRWSLEAFARLGYLYLTRPEARSSIRDQFGSSADSLETMRYGLFVGRKPETARR
ncbi:MAG TPA: class I SAM-dependent methyltransferase [Anaerolineae bacterium]|nr:class I SAM-dependent methyltransferase [Anaerolineae bacterium]